ncbi:transposase [Halococcus saccharolyticus DSM 5350]|uniref:Transposase n=1 Tax=Halococcus saccharolyticus DSM 5350 TaxID=1227455 RepID=M0MMS6_9EURY|nr:transposase [Halococcus saccharolyticus DSM 5350]
MDASAALWNELTYERRQRFFDGESVWDTDDYRKRYVGVLGSATAQQVIRKNREAWRSFFSLKEKGEAAGPSGYWGNEDDGRVLRTYVRNDQYTLETGERSRLEIPVGSDLKDEYGLGHTERLRLEVRGEPKWSGKQGRLELYYDELDDRFRAIQPVSDCSPRDTPLADETAALDIGANNIVAATTSTGQQFLYGGRDLFDRFRETTREIARLQSLLAEGRYTSERIRRLYRRRTRRRDHAMDALARDLIERLHAEGVSAVYVGALTDVLSASWSVRANAKTHNFWAFRAFIDRLTCTAEEFGITVEVRSEAWTSRECPNCGSTGRTTRHRDTLTCECGFEGHADLTASETFLRRHSDTTVPRPMARPVCLKWDDHRWSASPCARRPNEEHTNPQDASVEVGQRDRPRSRGFPGL